MKVFTAIIVITCLTQLPDVSAKVRNIKKLFARNNEIDNFFIDDGRLTRVQCDTGRSSYHCKIEQMPFPYENTTYSCEITPKKYDFRPFLIFNTFGKNKLIFIEPHAEEIVIFVVHLVECRISEGVRVAEVKKPEKTGALANQLYFGELIVTYDDKFDIFFNDVNSCGNEECRVTIDAEGKLIRGPVAYINHENDDYWMHAVRSIEPHSPDKGYVYIMQGHYGRDQNVSLVLPDGNEKRLAHHNDTVFLNANDGIFSVGFIHGLSPKVTCIQYDSLGNVKIQKDLTEPNKYIRPLYLYNIPKGGLLLLYLASKSIEDSSFAEVAVRKINAAGETIGKVNIEGFDFTKNWKPIPSRINHMWMDKESKKHCVAIVVYYGSDEKSTNDLTVNCFDDGDFSN